MKTGRRRASSRSVDNGNAGPGAPVADFQLEAPPAPEKRVGLVRQLFRDASNWRELRGTPYGARPAIIVALVSFFQLVDDAAYSAAGPDIARDLEVAIQGLGGILAIVGVLSLFGNLLVGWYADRHARLPIFGAGTILSGVFSAASTRASSLFTLGAPRVADAVSENAILGPGYSLTADYYPPETRGKAFAFETTLSSLAVLVAPVLLGSLIEFAGWRTAQLAVAVPLVVLGSIALLTLREPVRGYMERKALGAAEQAARVEDEPRSLGEAFRAVWASRTFRRLFIARTFLFSGLLTYAFYVNFFLADEYGLSAFRRGIALSPAAAAGILGGYLGGGIADSLIRRNPARIMTFLAGAVAGGGVVITLFGTAPPLAVFVTLLGIVGFAFGLVGPGLQSAFAQVIPPEVRTQGLAVYALSSLPALFLAIPVSGVVVAEYGISSVFYFAGPLWLVASAIAATAAPYYELDVRSALASAIAADEWRRTQAAGQGKLLVCRDVDVAYDGVQVLFGVDFDVAEGEIIALLGTNGAGKSTLLRAISGTQEASGGAIVFDGRDVTHMPPHEIAARRLIHMPGGRGIFPGMTVRENLLLGRWLTASDADAKARLREVFEIFPVLRERAEAQAGSLSGGEQQQLSLAQAFLASPKLLVIDELSLGLSPAVVDQLIEVVREINRRGVTIIVVEQSVNVALRLAERAVFMEKGEVRFFGDTKELLRRPDILRAVYVRGTEGLTGGTSALRGAAAVRRADELDRAAPLLECSDLEKHFGGVVAVGGVSFSLRDGEVLGLIGPNGAGKTTIFDIISGYQAPDAGTVRLEGEDIAHLGPEERAARKLVRRFQDARLFPSLTLHEALLVALDLQHQARNAALNIVQAPQSRRAERRLRLVADRLVGLLGLGAYRDKLVGELSTGLRRIADLACVLASEPRVLLLDEPSTGIASAEVEGLAPVLRRVRTETGCSILVIEHSMSLIASVSDRLIALDQGRIIAEGLPDAVLSDEAVVASYLGRRAAPAKT